MIGIETISEEVWESNLMPGEQVSFPDDVRTEFLTS